MLIEAAVTSQNATLDLVSLFLFVVNNCIMARSRYSGSCEVESMRNLLILESVQF